MPSKHDGSEYRANVARARRQRARATKMHLEGASYAEIKVACGYNTIKNCRRDIREGLRQYWLPDEEAKQAAISQAAGRLETAQRLAMRLMFDDATEIRDVSKLMDSLSKLQQRQAKLQDLDIKPTAEDDGNAVNLWLLDVSGADPTQRVDYGDDDESPEDEDGDEDLDDEDDE